MYNPQITINRPGDAHELTFSCYRRYKLFSKEYVRKLFLKSLAEARKKWRFEVWAYVIMPSHVHLLLHPLSNSYNISSIIKDIKQPVSRAVLKQLRQNAPGTLKLLLHSEKDGKPRYCFWQPGKGYDRNLYTAKAINASIRYMHANPVRARLCECELDWPSSSARWYADIGDAEFEVDRCNIFIQSK